ncbi:MAG: hypothetical protein JWM70_61 [Microbacteriaceae bacterium]|nr:hypothetical protein [Microbacteriaceae bacterium]
MTMNRGGDPEPWNDESEPPPAQPPRDFRQPRDIGQPHFGQQHEDFGQPQDFGQPHEDFGQPDQEPADDESRQLLTSLPGRIALGLSMLLLVLDVVALVLADNRSWGAATVLAQVATVGTIVAFVVGAAAVILSRGRRWGIAAVVLAVVANPIILTKVLGFLAG